MNPAVARLSPAAMSKFLNPSRQLAQHVWHLSDKLRDAIVAGRGRVIVCMPPGHAKSDTISVHLPVWALEIWPDLPIAITSYGHEKAMEWGAKIRDIISTNSDKLLTRLKRDSKAKHRWHTPEGGGVYCTGVGGALTGFRAGLGIVDDPVKDRVEAASETYRKRAWLWFNEVFLTRLHPDATAIVVQTRWHEDDLAGRLIAQGGWDVISFPYFAEEGDALGRDEGEPLWPEYGFDTEWGNQQMTAIGSQSWASLYQQRPSPEGGAVFKREHFRYYTSDDDFYTLTRPGMEPRRVLKALCWIGQACDTALKAKTTSDWTVCLTFAVTPDNDIIILDVARARLEVPDQIGFLYAARDKWQVPGWRWQAVEDKASGTGLIQEARRAGKPFRVLKADVDKVSRAMPAAVRYENGMVYHPVNASWLADFEHELLTFPNGAHDDQVDGLAYGVLETGDLAPVSVSSIEDDPVEQRWGMGIRKRGGR